MLTPQQLEDAVERHPLLVLRALRRLVGLGIVAKDRAYIPLLVAVANAARHTEGLSGDGVGHGRHPDGTVRRLTNAEGLYVGPPRWTDDDLRAMAPVCWECLVAVRAAMEKRTQLLNN